MIDEIMEKIKTLVDDAYQEGYQAGFIESKTLAEYLNNSKLKDIKAEIENTGILSSVDIKTGETLYEGLCRYSDVLEIIDKHIGKENECDT